MFFDNWYGLLRVVILAVFSYGMLILFLRMAGKRSLSKMNAFDLVITVALGSTLASITLTKNVALSEGILAFGVLILLQFSVTWLSVRSPRFLRLIKAQPRLLLYQGEYMEYAMKKERITRAEILAVVREQGHGDIASIQAVVLETDGSMSVITGDIPDQNSSLETVETGQLR